MADGDGGYEFELGEEDWRKEEEESATRQFEIEQFFSRHESFKANGASSLYYRVSLCTSH